MMIVVSIISEVANASYFSLYELSGITGHVFNLLSFWLLYQAVIHTSLREPFSILARGASSYNAIPDPALIVDRAGNIAQVNVAACEMAQLLEYQLVNQHLHRLFSLQIKSTDGCEICKNLAQGVSIRDAQIEIAETGRWYRYSLTLIDGTNSQGNMVFVCSDITQKKRAEASLVNSEHLLRTLLNTIPDLIWLKDREGRYMLCNEKFEQLYGVDESEIIGTTDYDYVDKGQADLFRKSDKKVMASDESIVNEEWVTYASDGHAELVETIKSPLFAKSGELVGVLGVARDITERYNSTKKQKQLQESLQQMQKMDSLGKLTGGIAHDFNNVLGVIVGYAGLLKEAVGDDPMLNKFAIQIERAGKRGTKMTHKLLAFSRKRALNQEVININRVLKDDLYMLEKSLTEKITIKLTLEDELWPVLLAGNELEDALLNMSINAMHAMPSGGELRIETRNITLDEVVSLPVGVDRGEYVLLSISDNGLGMEQEILAKIFDPFFTTKGKQGNGLGMSQVYGFVKRSNGSISVESELDKGTIFKMYFPRSAGEGDSNTPDECASAHHYKKLCRDHVGQGTILIVDDEGTLRELAKDMLSAQGYRVLTAEDGDIALSILERETVDLMLSDVIMKKMNGYQLANIVREKYPAIKIQMISGFSGDLEYVEEDDTLYLQQLHKPISPERLVHRIASLLDNRDETNIADVPKTISIVWDDKYSVGIDTIDADHKKLIKLVNRCKPGDGGGKEVDELLPILEELVSYTQYHFEREERVMEVCNYPELRKHCKVHQFIKQEVASKIRRLHDGVLSQEDFFQFFSDWLIDHVLGMDTLIAPYAAGKEQVVKNALAALSSSKRDEDL